MGHVDAHVPRSLNESILLKVHEIVILVGHPWGVVPFIYVKSFGYRAAIDVAAIFCSFHHLGEGRNINTVASS